MEKRRTLSGSVPPSLSAADPRSDVASTTAGRSTGSSTPPPLQASSWSCDWSARPTRHPRGAVLLAWRA